MSALHGVPLLASMRNRHLLIADVVLVPVAAVLAFALRLDSGQLQVLAERVRRKREICATYRQALGDLPGIAFMPEAAWGRATRWLTCITVDPPGFGADREAIRLALEAEDIESRPLWKPMHLQPVFASCPVSGGAVAAGLFERGLCLPSGTSLTDADLARVADVVRRVAGYGASAR